MLLDLFLAFLQIGAFSFGGGYAALPLIQQQVVELHSWLTMSEFTNLITISQMTPGPIAINSATFVGQSLYGVIGALVCTFGCVLPSLIIVIIISMLYVKYRNLALLQSVLRYLRPTVIAMILGSGISILLSCIFPSGVSIEGFQLQYLVLFLISFIVLIRFKKINPIYVMVACGVANMGLAMITML